MEAVQIEELTSGASGRIIPVFRNLRRSLPRYESLRRSLIFVQSIFLWFILVLRRRRLSSSSPPLSPTSSGSTSSKRKLAVRREEEDILRRRALAEGFKTVSGSDESEFYESTTSLFYGNRGNALFCRSWLPVFGEMK